MIPNNIISALPFYDSLSKQNHRKDYAYGDVFPLITPVGTIPPFQITRATRGNPVGQIYAIVRDLNGGVMDFVTEDINLTGLSINRYLAAGYDVIKYASTGAITFLQNEGQYYIELNDGVQTFYSEVFSVVGSVSQFLKIEYWDTENIEIAGGIIDFADNFKFRVYLNTQLGRPDYEFEEQVTKKDGYNFVEKQISEKTFKFSFLAPEYLCDALRIIRMLDNITITNKTDIYNADSFLITPKWQDGGYIAAIDAEFQCDTVIKKTGARFIPADNTDPDANNAKMYIGQVIDLVPTEMAVKALTELPALKQNTELTQFLELGKRFCYAYPTSFGDLTEAFILQGFNVLSVFNKTVIDFTFGETTVPMNVYVYTSPVTYLTTPPTQQTMHFSFTQPIINQQVGDYYGGGIVAYVFQPGDNGYVEGETHGIVAAPYDSPANGCQWSKSNYNLTGSSATTLGSGYSNSQNIVLSLGISIFPPQYAAWACRYLGIGNYTDWCLPCIDELQKLYDAKDIIGGFDNNMVYWSSSEYDADDARYINFTNGVIGYIHKGTANCGARAIRNF